MHGLSTSSYEISLSFKDWPPSLVPFAVGTNQISISPKGLRGENGNGCVITSRTRVQPIEEVVVALPFPCSCAVADFFEEVLAFFFSGPENGSSPPSDSSFSLSASTVFFDVLPSPLATLFLSPVSALIAGSS
jgi:hypothetical protein